MSHKDIVSSCSPFSSANVKPAEMQQTSALVQNQGDALSAKPLAATQLAHPETVPIVRQQLDALDTREYCGRSSYGRGKPWTGESRSAQPESQRWGVDKRSGKPACTWCCLRLGGNQRQVDFRPQGIRIQLGAAESATVELMSKQKTALQQGMETSGLRLAEIKIGAP